MRPLDADERLKRADWTVKGVPAAIGESLCVEHHYSRGCAKQSAYLHGLFRVDAVTWDAACVGVAHWLPPTRAVGKSLNPMQPGGVLALSRLVVEPGIPKNAATFLMARSMRLIDRVRWPVFVTYADTWRGHTGAIYKATGWTEDGPTVAKPVYIKDGRMVSPKSGPKTRTHDQMIALGCEMVGKFPKIRFSHRVTE